VGPRAGLDENFPTPAGSRIPAHPTRSPNVCICEKWITVRSEVYKPLLRCFKAPQFALHMLCALCVGSLGKAVIGIQWYQCPDPPPPWLVVQDKTS
jgi:hypothetical protein